MISKNLNKMYYNRIKISRPLEKDFYFGNKLNRNQSILINNVYYNIDRLINLKVLYLENTNLKKLTRDISKPKI